MSELQIIDLNVDQYGLQENKAKSIKELYVPMINGLEKVESEFNELIVKEVTKKTIKEFKTMRLKISKLRTNADKVRKEAKEEYLQVNKAIQGAYNTFEYATKSKELKLLEKEKYFENLEIERIENLQIDRANEIEEYNVFPIPSNLGEMDLNVWDMFLSGAKSTFELNKKAEELAEKERLEKERIEKEEEELLRLKQIETQKENERLKKEAEEKQKLIDEENKKREEKELKERVEQQKILQKEIDEKEELRKQVEKSKQDEILRLRKIEDDKQLELSKDDSDKIMSLIFDLESIKEKYNFKSAKNKKMFNDVIVLIDKIQSHIEK
jgi:hypothetical protein